MRTGMLNHTISTMDFDPQETHRPSMAWFLPTFVGVFMTVFLIVSWILHHRRFRERHKHRELLEYYLELQVECGRRRVAAPSTSSSIRTNEDETDFKPDSETIVSLVARSSLDPVISVAINENGTRLTRKKKKRKKDLSKVTYEDSGIFKFFDISWREPFTNGECSEEAEGSDHVRSLPSMLPPISSNSSPQPLPIMKVKEKTKRAQSDLAMFGGSRTADDRRHPVKNNVILLKTNSLQPLDKIEVDYMLDKVKHNQSIV